MSRKIVFPVLGVILLALYLTHPAWFVVHGVSLAMAIAVKDITASAAKYATRAANAAGDYKTGVQNAGQKWHDMTKASTDNYAQGVQAAISNGSFGKGVDKAGPQRFADRAAGKGATAFPQGVRDGQGRWAANFAPFAQVLAAATLPPKGPKGDPRNQARSQYVADLLRKKKLAG